MTTLISFLGKNRRDPASGGYQRATYQFDDGRRVQTPFLGSALMQQLRPDRTLLPLKSDSAAFRSLSDIRNMLAHGTVSGDSARDRQATSATATATDLASWLRHLANELPRQGG